MGSTVQLAAIRQAGACPTKAAVKQKVGRQFPDRPQAVDPKQAPDQFGVPSNLFKELLDNVIPGSVKGL